MAVSVTARVFLLDASQTILAISLAWYKLVIVLRLISRISSSPLSSARNVTKSLLESVDFSGYVTESICQLAAGLGNLAITLLNRLPLPASVTVISDRILSGVNSKMLEVSSDLSTINPYLPSVYGRRPRIPWSISLTLSNTVLPVSKRALHSIQVIAAPPVYGVSVPSYSLAAAMNLVSSIALVGRPLPYRLFVR